VEEGNSDAAAAAAAPGSAGRAALEEADMRVALALQRAEERQGMVSSDLANMQVRMHAQPSQNNSQSSCL
jgi:hypothetical protein